MLRYLLCCLLLCGKLFAQNINEIDSLHKILRQEISDSLRCRAYNQLGYNYRSAQPDSTKFYAEKSIAIAQVQNIRSELSFAYGLMAGYYRRKLSYRLASEYLLRALKIDEETGNIQNLTWDYVDLGNLYREHEPKKAEIYYQKALGLTQKFDNPRLRIISLYNCADIASISGKFASAQDLAFKALQASLRHKDKYRAATCLNLLARIQFMQKKYDSAAHYSQKALNAVLEVDNKYWLANISVQMGRIYTHQKQFEKAKIHHQNAIKICLENDYDILQDAYFGMSELYELQKNFELAYQYYIKYTSVKDSLQKQRDVGFFETARQSHELEKRQKELEIIEARNSFEKDSQRKIFTLIVVFLLISAAGLYYTLLTKQKANTLLKVQKSEIQQQAEELQSTNQALHLTYQELERKNKDIEDSIKVAQRIQNSLLPSAHTMKEILDDFFLLYLPCDVMSGDFYWCSQQKNTRIVAVADCTGHGVPGALISMMGMQLLDKIVNENRILSPQKILQILHWELVKLLKQKENHTQEGMDIALMSLVPNENGYTLSFAGAMNPLYYVQNGSLGILKADKQGIGGSGKQQFFEQKNLELEHFPTTIYLFSDGYQDQFGGKKNKKFMTGNFRKLLAQISEKNMEEQAQILENTIQEWRKTANESQTDDITVLGIRLNAQNYILGSPLLEN